MPRPTMNCNAVLDDCDCSELFSATCRIDSAQLTLCIIMVRYRKHKSHHYKSLVLDMFLMIIEAVETAVGNGFSEVG